jgi:hypothetical protein
MELYLTAPNEFKMTGTLDQFQLLIEALEIAGASADKFAPQFQSLATSLMEESEDWG